MSDKKDEEKNEDDERIEFLSNYLTLSRKIKSDKWIKMLTNEEYKEIIIKFFDTPSEIILTIQLNSLGILVPFLKIPPTGQAKASYFIKKIPVEITKENYRDIIILGDMALKPIEELSVLIEEAYIPILSNPKNHKGWPSVISEDVKKHIYNFGNAICQIKGNMMGQTLLPMPMGIEHIFEAELIAQQSGGAEIDLLQILFETAQEYFKLERMEFAIRYDGGGVFDQWVAPPMQDAFPRPPPPLRTGHSNQEVRLVLLG